MSHVDDSGRDLRVDASLGALVRLGLAEIVKRVSVSTPLSTMQAAEHVQYELNRLKSNWQAADKVAEGTGGKSEQ